MESPPNTGATGIRPPSALDKTAAGAHQTVDKLADAAAPAVDRLASTAHQTVDALARRAAPAADWFEESAQRFNRSSAKIFDDAKQCMREYPVATLAAAVAVGIIISHLTRSRS